MSPSGSSHPWFGAAELPQSHTDRRGFLRRLGRSAGAAALAGLASGATQGAASAADASQGDPAIIDAHVHVWTPDTIRYPLAAGFRREEMQPPSFTAEELLAQARPAGVGRIVLVQMSFYGFDHRYLLETLVAYPGVFGGIGVIDDEADRPDEEMRRLAQSGVRGFRIYPRNRPIDRWLDGAGMQRMWRCGADDGLAMCHLVNPEALPAIDAMCGRHPDTPVVIDHFARIGIDGTIRPADLDALCRLARHRHTFVKVSAFYALGRKQPPYDDLVPMIRRLTETFGPARLMWGTDCPYQVAQQSYRDSLQRIERLDFLSADERAAILGKTAAGLFFPGSSPEPAAP